MTVPEEGLTAALPTICDRIARHIVDLAERYNSSDDYDYRQGLLTAANEVWHYPTLKPPGSRHDSPSSAGGLDSKAATP